VVADRRWRSWFKAAVGLLGILAVIGPVDARAATYRVETCQTEDLRPIGPAISDRPPHSGWSFFETRGFALFRDDCASGQGGLEFFVLSDNRMAAGEAVGLRWTAPSGTALIAVRMWLGVYADNAPTRGQGTTNAHWQPTVRRSLPRIAQRHGVGRTGQTSPARWLTPPGYR
jgi:hypothetical protein